MSPQQTSLTCLIPARNESGHLKQLCRDIIDCNIFDELIIVEGGSSDNTWEVAQELSHFEPELIRSIQQDGRGKMNAVLCGIQKSVGEYVVIWDADGTVPVADVKRLVALALKDNVFVKGDRLRGKRSPKSMKPINFLGNWFFAVVWAPLLKEIPSDVLCGSKVFPRRIHESLTPSSIKLDPYGDFALMLAAVKSGCKVKSLNVDYLARSYGMTNINRWRGAAQLFRFVVWMYFNKILKRS